MPNIAPMVCGIWCGETKPVLNEFLNPLVSELMTILESGITINSHHVAIKMGRILGDTPARSLIKGTVNHNHKFGCQKCEVAGEYFKVQHRMSFPKTDARRRTNETFRAREQKMHHKETSLLEKLDIDMIKAFPTSDSLHLLDLGIMRKCMYRWVFGIKGYTQKWNKATIDTVSRLLKGCQPQMPSDIHRAVRGLDCLKRWKGLEYRTILLYVGMVVLKDVLPEHEYHHFLILCCAVNICSSKVYYKASIPLASKLFGKYVQMYIEIYGEDTITSNVHSLIHITEDLNDLNICDLAEISTYKYENCLRLLGLKVKHCNLPLEQVAKRITEMASIEKDEIFHSHFDLLSANKFSPKVYYEKRHGNYKTYDKIEIKSGVFLSNRKIGDSWFLAKSFDAELCIVKMKHAVQIENKYRICGVSLNEKREFFKYPVTSTKLNIYASDGTTNHDLDTFEIESIVAKMICLSYNAHLLVFIPLLHTLSEIN